MNKYSAMLKPSFASQLVSSSKPSAPPLANTEKSMATNRCSNCGSIHTGRSPTGDWCNSCGTQSPCPCYAGDKENCGAHVKHDHVWDERGCCIAMHGCAAKKAFQVDN